MLDERPEPFAQRELIEAFARGELVDAQRVWAQRLLEQSEPARELFRQLTAGRYPQVPNYTIIGQVGKGGFGVVYKAIQHDKERAEALKILFSKTPLLTSYFQNEVKLIARLRHPNIATLFEAQLSAPPLYYTMEFVEGERLNDHLKKRTISLADRIGIVKTVAQAIDYAHAQGVVHRDVKPQNVLIDDSGQPHVVDFGISISLGLAPVRPSGAADSSAEDRGGPVGTLGYIAPEQEKGGPVDARADIFALGALLFHAVTGEPARLAKVADQRTRILREKEVPRPEDLGAIVGRCVEDSPDRRYPACAALAADLDSYLAGRPISVQEGFSPFYQAFRILALVMRDRPLTIRMTVAIVVAGFLTWLFWTMETHAGGVAGTGDQTVIIAFTDGTLAAIKEGRIGAGLPGLSADVSKRKSWRMLYGRLLEKLASAEPQVILWDEVFEQCSEYDDYLVRGLRAFKAPIVVAVRWFDSRGEPQICETIRDEVTDYGTPLGADADKHPHQYEVAHCLQRRFAPPIPGVALAAFSALRFPDHQLQLELDADKLRLHARYRKWHLEPGPPRGEVPADRFAERDFSLHDIKPVRECGNALIRSYVAQGWLNEDDRIAHALVKAQANAHWSGGARTIPFEKALTASSEQLRTWFHNKAIVVGHKRQGLDQHARFNKEMVFGCQIQAEAVDELLSGMQYHRFDRWELAARHGICCVLAVVVVSILPTRKWLALRWVTLMCAALFAAGVIVGGGIVMRIDERWLLEPLIATTALLTAGSAAFWAKVVRERQLGLRPSAITLESEGSTLPSTVLAETR